MRVKNVMAGLLVAFAILAGVQVGRVQAAQKHDLHAMKVLVPLTIHAQLTSCPGTPAALHCALVSWTASVVDATHSAATGYKVYRTTTSGGCSTVTAIGCTNVGTTTTQLSLTDSPLAGSTTYFWVVTATNVNGTTTQESGPSAQATATTPPDPVNPPNPPTGVQAITK